MAVLFILIILRDSSFTYSTKENMSCLQNLEGIWLRVVVWIERDFKMVLKDLKR